MHFLPQCLIALLLASPAWAALENKTQNTLAEPFHHIARHAPKQTQDPVCCLRPLDPQEPVPELLTFEEWKEKQKQQNPEPEQSTSSLKPADLPEEAYDGQDVNIQQQTQVPDRAPSAPRIFNQVPLVDRFNYASEDCSARIHNTHKGAQSSSAVLSSKKDKYMLSPCSTKDKFMIVELCDDIRIDTVQLANFEFFSGVFRSIRISVAQTYTSDTEGWVEMGTYEAKNVRSVQSFHPLTELRPFYRYIRIDFLSHYGSEYYCPISLLRVYGVTQMEEWKWDAWEADSQKRAAEAALRSVQSSEANESATVATPWPTAAVSNGSDESVPVITSAIEQTEGQTATQSASNSVKITNPPSPPIDYPQDSQAASTPSISDDLINIEVVTERPEASFPPAGSENGYIPAVPHSTDPVMSSPTQDPERSSSSQESEDFKDHTLQDSAITTPTSVIQSDSESPSPSTTISSNAPSARLSSTYVPTPSPSPRLIAAHAMTNVPSGESVFRTIANRISVLESNTTLYMQYVEVQNRSIREAIRKLEEDVGRLAGITKTQTAAFQKAVGELAKQRHELETERLELVAQVNYLAREVLLEKRLGIAQLILLLLVLSLMFISRNPQSETIFRKTTSAVKRFGTRNRVISLSSDWGMWRSRSSTPAPTTPTREFAQNGPHQEPEVADDHEDFIQPRHLSSPREILPPLHVGGQPFPRKHGSRTSSSASESKPGSSTVLRPPLTSAIATRPRILQRSSSQNAATLSLSPASVFSPRRLAKTAHLHELKSNNSTHGLQRTPFENVINRSRTSSHGRIRQRRTSKLTPRLLTSKDLPLTSGPTDTLNPPTVTDDPVQRENGHESDPWVDTDDAADEDQTQEIEFPRLRDELSILLSSPPGRRSAVES